MKNELIELSRSTIAEIEYNGKTILIYLDKYSKRVVKTDIERYIEERQKWGN